LLQQDFVFDGQELQPQLQEPDELFFIFFINMNNAVATIIAVTINSNIIKITSLN